jgi:hypothetical protein
MASFIRWIPHPCSDSRFSTASGFGHLIGVESLPLVRDDDGHSLAPFAAAMDVNQRASLQAIAVEHRVAQGIPKREFDIFLSADTARRRDKAHKPFHQR